MPPLTIFMKFYNLGDKTFETDFSKLKLYYGMCTMRMYTSSNLCYVNKQILLEPGGWFNKFDYKSGFRRVDILLSHWKYLGFGWTDNKTGVVRIMIFLCYPLAWPSYHIFLRKYKSTLLNTGEAKASVYLRT